jgi:hypothetical protein
MGEDLVAIRTQIDRLEAEFIRRLQRFDRHRAALAEGAVSTVSWVRGRCGLNGAAAAERVRMARVLHELPETTASFRAGRAPFTNVALIARLAGDVGTEATRSVEDTLVGAAATLDVGRMSRLVAFTRYRLDADGALERDLRTHEHHWVSCDPTFVVGALQDATLEVTANNPRRNTSVETPAPIDGMAMSTLENRPNTALLVVDVQTCVVEGTPRRDAVVANVGTLVEKARQEQVPVVWVQHSDEQIVRGSDGWRIVPELAPDDAEPLVEKHYGDSFEDTSLETVLSGLGVGRLMVVGAQTDACIRSTLHGALARGYDATLVSDAHTTEDQTEWGAPPPEMVIAHTNLYWTYQTAPGRTAGTVETKDVDFKR